MKPAAESAPAGGLHAHTPGRKKQRRLPPGAFRRDVASAFIGMGLSTFDKADAAGLVPQAHRVGGLKIWSRRELSAWIDHGCPPRGEWGPLWAALLARRNRR
jgi:predicted DNA-binding transcriptional regulator AlpA